MLDQRRCVAVFTSFVFVLSLAGCGGFGSSERASPEEKAKSAAAAKLTAYRDAARPVLADVFAQVEPVQDAYADANKATGSDYAPIEDVLKHGRVPASLTALKARLAAIPAPPELTSASTAAGTAIGGLADAVSAFPSFTNRVQTPTVWRAAISAAKERMDATAASLTTAVAQIFPTDPPPTPVGAGIASSPKSVASRSGFLLGAAHICSPVAKRMQHLTPAATAKATVVATVDRISLLLADVYKRLLALPVPAPDAAALERTVRQPLTARPTIAEAGQEIVAAARARDRARAEAALLTVDAATASARTAAAGMRAYGSTTCAGLLDQAGQA